MVLVDGNGFFSIFRHQDASPAPPLEAALEFADQVRSASRCCVIVPGPRQWAIFERLCREAGARGNLVPDAFLASMAIESGSEWITTDRGFGRFPGLRWRHPLD
jgi:predicted nucleic acid-binding protein